MHYIYIFWVGSTMSYITEHTIAELVDRFYSKVRRDELIGPIFEAAIGEQWDAHLAKMRAFWSSVMLATRSYKGNPMMTHLQLPRLRREHFDRWLDLWRETAAEVCSEPGARAFVQRAEMIAERFLYAIDYHHQAAAMEASLQGV
jgi:hemoglobin